MSEANARGGRNAMAALSFEERSRRARKVARTLGKEGREARAAKGWETRRAKATTDAFNRASVPTVNTAVVPACLCQGTLEPVDGFEINHSPKSCGWIREGEPGTKAFLNPAALRSELETIGAPKPKRSPPKPGTLGDRVLRAVRQQAQFGPVRTADIEPAFDGTWEELLNGLSSLLSGGHVISEPMPGSKREKLWRVAP